MPRAPRTSSAPHAPPAGEVRAHLLPSKACRPRTTEALPTAPQPAPPPLPRKTLTRTQSVPTHRPASPGRAPRGPPRRPLLGSRSLDEGQAGGDKAGPPCPPAEPALGPPDAALGLSVRDLQRPEAVRAALEAWQLGALRAVHARLRARLLGGHPGPCHPGHALRLLDSSPCAESGDALYYRVVRVDGDAWHVLAAKVSPPQTQPETPAPAARPASCFCD